MSVNVTVGGAVSVANNVEVGVFVRDGVGVSVAVGGAVAVDVGDVVDVGVGEGKFRVTLIIRSAMASPFFPRRVNRRVNFPLENSSSKKSHEASFSSEGYSISLSSTNIIHLEGSFPSPYSRVQVPKFSSTVINPKMLMPVSLISAPSLGFVMRKSG